MKDLVDKNVEGLPGQLLDSFQGMSWTPLGAPADPGSTLLHAEQLQRMAAKTSRKTSSANPGVDPQPDDAVLVSGVGPTRAVSLPLVTPTLKQHIIKGEHVDFDQLLPESMFPSRYNTNTPLSITLCLSSDPSLSGSNIMVTQPRAANKHTVTDHSSWFEVWNVYAAVVVTITLLEPLPCLPTSK